MDIPLEQSPVAALLSTAKAEASEGRARAPVAGKAAVKLNFPQPYYRGGQYFASLVADQEPALPSRLRLES